MDASTSDVMIGSGCGVFQKLQPGCISIEIGVVDVVGGSGVNVLFVDEAGNDILPRWDATADV